MGPAGEEDLIAVESEQVPRDMRFVGVLGQASELCGLSFFDSRRAFERVFELADAGDIPTRSNGVIFDRIDGLPFADVDVWQDHGLPVAAPEAYALAADFAVDRSVRRPSARELSFSEGLLRALATATEDELDAGSWQTPYISSPIATGRAASGPNASTRPPARPSARPLPRITSTSCAIT